MDAPVYIPQKFKSLKFNQKPNINMENSEEKNLNDNNTETNKKEEKIKKPFEIREGDWTCEFCYNLNFAFRTKCNRCGIVKNCLQNLGGNNDSYNYPNIMKSNLYLDMINNANQNSYHNYINSIDNRPLFSPNKTNYS